MYVIISYNKEFLFLNINSYINLLNNILFKLLIFKLFINSMIILRILQIKIQIIINQINQKKLEKKTYLKQLNKKIS